MCGSLARETGNAGGTRACIPNGKIKWFYHSNLSSFGTVQSTLGEVKKHGVGFDKANIIEP
jgi:hypothetical protein